MKLTVLVFFLALLIPRTHAETPRQFGERFYRAYFRWDIRGAPNTPERHMISAYFGTEVLHLFSAVERQRVREHQGFLRKHRNEPNPPQVKPIWSKEGDPFSSVYEGISTFAIGRPEIRNGRITVPAHLEYLSDGRVHSWTDVLVLDRAGESWVVADIRFRDGKTLVFGLRAGIAESEPYLQSYPK